MKKFIFLITFKSESNEISSKEIATCSEFKPYYLTKALQKLKDLNLLSKTKRA